MNNREIEGENIEIDDVEYGIYITGRSRILHSVTQFRSEERYRRFL